MEEKFIKIAMNIIKQETDWEFVCDVHRNGRGYDLKYKDPKENREIFVEIKGRGNAFKDAKTSQVSLEQTCYDFATKNPQNYYIIMVHSPEKYKIILFEDIKKNRIEDSSKEKIRPAIKENRKYQIYFNFD